MPGEGKIVIVQGENGAGKTALMNGLTWCLYNKKANNKELINDKAVAEAKLGKKVKMYIEIHFNWKNKLCILNRTVGVRKAEETLADLNEEYTLEIIEGAKSCTINDDMEIGYYINNILNETVENYFFFDGARIETFTKENHNKDVEKALKSLLKIDTIKRGREHIKVIINEITNSVKEDSEGGEIEQIRLALEELETKIQESERGLRDVTTNISQIETDCQKLQMNYYKMLKEIYSKSLYNLSLFRNRFFLFLFLFFFLQFNINIIIIHHF